MTAAPPVIVGLGEILWDLFPDGPRLGGAPFNFTFHCHRLGATGVMVSRVGEDDLGRDIRARLRGHGLTDEAVQADPAHPTGTVRVTLSPDGQPAYDITREVAYDFLDWTPGLERVCRSAKAVCFGSLVQRHPVARAAVRQALGAAANALTVFDINLRQTYYDRDVIEASLRASRWVKLNDHELTVLTSMLGLTGGTDAARVGDLRRRYALELAALTRGEHGCLVQTDTAEVELPGEKVRVADTVGAGDSFTAGLLVATLEGRSVRDAATFANRLAARVAAAPGGTPLIDLSDLR